MVEVKMLTKCINYVAEKHKNQRRKDIEKIPYINHPIECAFISSIINDDENMYTIAAACLLHDIAEDNHDLSVEDTLKEINDLFGSKIARIVTEVTDDKTLDSSAAKLKQIELAKDYSYEASVVRICDKISNVRALNKTEPESWDLDRKQRYLLFTKTVVDNIPIHNINITTLKQIFYNLYKEKYEELNT